MALRAGLIGTEIQASRSPAMHMAEAGALGLELSYELFDLRGREDALAAVLDEVEAQGFAGVNVTHPFKQRVLPLLDDLAGDARALGAVNTVVFRPEGRIGHNTDWSGFAENLRRGLPRVRRQQVVQFGAGGVGAATAYALLREGVGELSICDVNTEAARALCARMSELFGAGRARPATEFAAVVRSADGVVNASPVGMFGHPGTPLATALLRPQMWVAEVIYFPLATELLEAARRIGCATLGGGGMAVFQAADAFELFTNLRPDVERMLRRFDSSSPT